MKTLPELAGSEISDLILPSNDQPVHEWFEMQVLRTPLAPALICQDITLTYQILNEKANRLAAQLRVQGVGPDTLVALCMDNRPELVISILAVLKAGGAYVPIDLSNPNARIKYIVADTSVSIMLTVSPYAERLIQMVPQLICVDCISIDNHYSTCNVPQQIQMQNLIYCIYTSGSTGQPKGALNEHRGFSNLVRWYIDDVGMTADDRVIVASSIGFDLTQKNILAPLCAGACVLLPSYSPANAQAFLQAFSVMRPTWINCAPSVFRTFSGSPRTRTLKTVVLGGEPIDDALILSLAGREVRLVNSYGPAECSDVAIWNVWDIADLDAARDRGQMPIGLPIRNVEILLLDSNQKSVAAGQLGEICISGLSVGRGYLNRQELNFDRFISYPHAPTTGKIYKTGDIGKLTANKLITFVGRQDSQIKIRGQRVELGEIESLLLTCEMVKSAVVCAYTLTPDDTRIVAYVVVTPNILFSIDTITKMLLNHLPTYMIPRHWVQLDVFPLNLSGKIDRQALPKPDWGR
ncbi:amino acid adenylation domain-containing protein [Pseudomonas sp. NFACC02]|uniref:non-ribosomal peptide synthetase n=1 Tax=Pseudomonas sp. NFACC02 TaxID=1566250 RepID=UPI0008D4A556|nr:amino acid adenylation domain-containing protein [Pseudomonas sp. NFACC02]SEQ54952.1 amino acid adenylation domain-containing protein [Pseudomonas sp. NFACC02]